MPSFDAVLEPNLVEVRNAVEQTAKEIATRFDFKGTSAAVDLSEAAKGSKQREVTLWGDSDFQLQQVRDVITARLSKRGVDLRFVDFTGTPQKIGGDRLKLVAPLAAGIDADTARKIQQAIKAAKLKVQAAYQGDAVRVTGPKRDELQQAIALLKREVADLPLTFTNFRE
jgi:cyclic-di-GMP-binding protein